MTSSLRSLRSLEDLPDLSGRSVLVRATLDLPFGYDLGSPLAAIRAQYLHATLSWLVARAETVTVCGDVTHPGATTDADQVTRVRQILHHLAPGVETIGVASDVEQEGYIEKLIDAHDTFVNDSYQWSYLPLPSLMVPAQRLPCAAGRGLYHDVQVAYRVVDRPDRPFVAVLGGDNSFRRLHHLRGLVLRADDVAVGGAMSLPFLRAIGKRRSDAMPEGFVAECRSVMGLAERVGHAIHLPLDLLIARPDGSLEVVPPDSNAEGDVVDIGPLTAQRYLEHVQGASTVLWCGALGRVEQPAFSAGTRTVAAGLPSDYRTCTVVGGDALVAFLDSERRLGPSIDIVTATDPLLEMLKDGELAALRPLLAATR